MDCSLCAGRGGENRVEWFFLRYPDIKKRKEKKDQANILYNVENGVEIVLTDIEYLC